MPPFAVFSLPRSRSAWVARFLTYGDWLCGHEEIRHCRSLDDAKSWLAQPCAGSAETSGAPFWRLLLKWHPDVRIAIIRRPVGEVVASMMALGLGFNEAALLQTMARLDHKLNQIAARVPGVLQVDFAALSEEATCARLFEHCLPYKHDPAWWDAVSTVNIQINMALLMRYYRAHEPQLAKLTRIAKQQTIAGFACKAEIDGVTFQPEPFEAFYRDAKALFGEHLVQTGQAPDEYMHKNLPVLRMLDTIGALQIMTARSNGRMFGYLMSIVAPSLDSPDKIEATHTTFFASPDIRNLGMKLQRAALEALRERGVDDVFMRAGVRASGPRLGAFYRRLGAAEIGQLYQLDLGA